MFKKILLVVDGPPSTSKAVSMAVGLALSHGASLTALYIINGGWERMLGDEWISSDGARRRFLDYLEGSESEKARRVLEELVQCENGSGLRVVTQIKKGKPEMAIISAYREHGPFDLVILPHPARKNAMGGAKINLEKTAGGLACPVLIVPA